MARPAPPIVAELDRHFLIKLLIIHNRSLPEATLHLTMEHDWVSSFQEGHRKSYHYNDKPDRW